MFIPNFKINDIEDDPAFCAITHYIHANPVHHGFVKDIRDWTFSSFQSLCSDKPTKLERDYVLALFGNKQAFLNFHAKPIAVITNGMIDPIQNFWKVSELSKSSFAVYCI